MPGKQVEIGKAFEYACLVALNEKYSSDQTVIIQDSPQYHTAKSFFEEHEEAQASLMSGAIAAVTVIDRLEPKLGDLNSNDDLVLSMQTDSQGEKGDVRDVVCIRGNDWEIGLSCKHNHDAVKHSRLSGTIDFGKEWLGYPCSQTYWDEVRPTFEWLKSIREDGQKTRMFHYWSELADKEERIYKPVLQSFMDELKRLSEANADVPAKLVQYLLGRKDFYKVITNEKGHYTTVQAVNINGTLGKPVKGHKALVNIPVVKLPTRFYHIDFVEGSMNKIEVVMDGGWNLTMRIHNASSKIEGSLKFDVRMEAMPNSIYSENGVWDL